VIPGISDTEIMRRFQSHKPESWQIQAMEEIRTECQNFARIITRLVPPGREQALALTDLERVMFNANAGIARPVPSPTGGS
jgi:hypothetical protein